MSKPLVIICALLLGVGGFAAGVYFQASGTTAVDSQPQPKAATAGVSVPKIELTGAVDAEGGLRPEFDFVDQFGKERRISDWDGKVVVVNFWATWCAPCLIEIPFFVETQKRLSGEGLQFVGVALDDSDKVKVFADDMGMNYPSAHGQQNALDLMRAYGNKTGGLPFTAFVDRNGRVAFRKAGVMTEEELQAIIANLLKGT